MTLLSEYPDNWTEIATAVKRSAGYRCNNCGLKCLPPASSYRHLGLSLRRRLSAQVHHLDRNPRHNDRENLVCLCSGCHLRQHRHHPQPSPGQLSLKLKLPANRRSRRKPRNFQMTFADLIERLPRLSMESVEQLELAILQGEAFAEAKASPTPTSQNLDVYQKNYAETIDRHSHAIASSTISASDRLTQSSIEPGF